MHRLTNATFRLFEKFSYGKLKLFEDTEIEQNMKSNLSWNNARKICESECERSYKGSPSEYNEFKSKFVTNVKIKSTLTSNWKTFKKAWPIFDKLPHFAICRFHKKNLYYRF